MAQVKGYMIQGIEFREWVQRTGYRLQNTVYKAQGTQDTVFNVWGKPFRLYHS